MTATVPSTQYRYKLTRHHAPDESHNGKICWVMLNPSTADESKDDPTIRKVMGFSWNAGYSDIVVVNLFAARATEPRDLMYFADPVGVGNDIVVGEEMTTADAVVFAWGAWYGSRVNRIATPPDVMGIAKHYCIKPLCLGLTSAGHPNHPLMLPWTTQFVPFDLGA